MKKMFTLITLISVILVGCSTDEMLELDTSSLPDGGARLVPTTQTKIYQVGETYQMGETANNDGWEIQILSAKYTSPEEYSPPSNGKVLTLEVAVTNTKSEVDFIVNSDFNLYDIEGNKLEKYYYEELGLNGEVGAGNKINGKLYFYVKGSEEYYLVYTPLFSEKQANFKIIPTN